MSSLSPKSVSLLLAQWHAGDDKALQAVLPLVYDELRRLARHYMRGERPDHTLQGTALVHEAYLRLIDQSRVDWQGRTHFFAVGAQAPSTAGEYQTQAAVSAFQAQATSTAVAAPPMLKPICAASILRRAMR